MELNRNYFKCIEHQRAYMEVISDREFYDIEPDNVRLQCEEKSFGSTMPHLNIFICSVYFFYPIHNGYVVRG